MYTLLISSLIIILVIIGAVSLHIVTIELLIRYGRRRVWECSRESQEWNSEKIRVTFEFVRSTLLNHKDSRAIQTLEELQQIESKLYQIEGVLREKANEFEQLVNHSRRIWVVMRAIRASRELYQKFVAEKDAFEKISGTIVSFYNICAIENARFNDVYERRIAGQILELFADANYPFAEKLNYTVDEWSRTKESYERLYQRKSERRLIKNLRDQRRIIIELNILCVYAHTLYRLKTVIFPQKYQLIENRIQQTRNPGQWTEALKRLEADIQLFEKEFYMSDTLLTLNRAQSIISTINQINQQVLQQIKIATLYRESYPFLMEFYESRLYALNLFIKDHRGRYQEIEQALQELEQEYRSHLEEHNDQLDASQQLAWAFDQSHKLNKIAQQVVEIKNRLIAMGNRRVEYDERLKSASNNLLLCSERIDSQNVILGQEELAILNTMRQSLDLANNLRLMATTDGDYDSIEKMLLTIEGGLPRLLIKITQADLCQFLATTLVPLLRRRSSDGIREQITIAGELNKTGDYAEALAKYAGVLYHLDKKGSSR